MDELSERIKRVRQDLAAIERLLNGTSGSLSAPLRESAAPADSLKELKLAVDEMRAFLWAHFSPALQQVDQEIFAETGAMAPPLTRHPVPASEIRSFFEEVQNLATMVVERHMNGEHS